MIVNFSGLIGYPSDDINKFLWMVRIGGGVFPHIKEPDYLVSSFLISVLFRIVSVALEEMILFPHLGLEVDGN